MPKRTTTKATKAGRKPAAGRPARSSAPEEALSAPLPEPEATAVPQGASAEAPLEPQDTQPAEPPAAEADVVQAAPVEAALATPESVAAPAPPACRERVLKVARPWGHPAVDGFRNELHEWLNAVWEGRVPEGERLILEV